MNEKAKAVSAASLAGLFALFAVHGEAFFRGAMGAWKFLVAITSTAPLGVGAFLWALAFSVLVQLGFRRVVPPGRNQHSRAALEYLVALAVAVHVCWLQVPGRNGVMIGLLAGLSSPLVTRIILALSTWVGITREDRAFAAGGVPGPAPGVTPDTPPPGQGGRPVEVDPDADK